MKLIAVSNEPPRTTTARWDAPCTTAHHMPTLSVEVRCEVATTAREEELLRRACCQRLAHLRDRMGAVGDICRSALGARRNTSFC